MSLTPTAAWLAAFSKATVRPRFLVSIYDGTNTWTSVSGSMDLSSDLYGTVEGVRNVANLETEIDPLTRELETSECFVDFDDAYLRPIVVSTVLKSKTVTVHLGAAELDNADFLDYFSGPIEKIVPRGDGVVSLVCLTVFQVLERNLISGYWLNKHPFEALYAGDGTGILEKGGATSFNTTSFDPDNYTDDIAHIKGGRGGAQYVREGNGRLGAHMTTGGMYTITNASALGVAQYLLQMVNAFLTTDESGALKICRFDSTDSAVDDWDEDDIIAGSFKQVEADNLINRVVCKFGGSPEGFTETYEANDTASQTTYAFPGGAATRIVAHEMYTDWLSAVSTIQANLTAGDISLVSFGNNENFAGNSSDGHAAISATQPAYLLLDSAHIAGKGYTEIVKATSLTRSTVDDGYVRLIDPVSGSIVDAGPYCNVLTYGGLTQFPGGGAGTAYNHTAHQTFVYDVTPLVILADEILARFANGGCPIVEVSTLLTKIRYSVGDLVTLTWPDFLAYGYDGITSAIKWQIVRKEPDVMSGKIDWTLAWAGTNVITRTARGHGVFSDINKYGLDSVAQETLDQGRVGSGLVVSDAGGLNISISAGEARGHNVTRKLLSAFAKTVTASKDTHICMHLNSGALIFHVVTVGDGYTVPAEEVFIAKVTTSADDILAISTTGKQTDPIDGGMIVDETLTNTQMSPTAGIVGTKLSSGAGCLAYLSAAGYFTDFDRVNDGSTYRKLAGVSGMGLLPVDDDTGSNLLGNATFGDITNGTSTPNGWAVEAGTPGTDFYLVDDKSAIGALSLLFENTTPASNPYLRRAESVAVQAGQVYRLSALVQVDNIDAGHNVYLQIKWYTRAGVYDSVSEVWNTPLPVANEYVEISGVVTVPATAMFGKVFIGKENHAYHVWFDTVSLVRHPRSFEAYLAGDSAAQTKATWPLVEIDTENHDYGGLFNTTTHLFTAKRAGPHGFSACVEVSGCSDGDQLDILLKKNGATWKYGSKKVIGAAQRGRVTIDVPRVVLARGDTVGVYVNDEETNFVIEGGDAYTYFSGWEIT